MVSLDSSGSKGRRPFADHPIELIAGMVRSTGELLAPVGNTEATRGHSSLKSPRPFGGPLNNRMLKVSVPADLFLAGTIFYAENHSLGEWFQRRLLPMMQTIKTPFAKIEVRSDNCTNKQREVLYSK